MLKLCYYLKNYFYFYTTIHQYQNHFGTKSVLYFIDSEVIIANHVI